MFPMGGGLFLHCSHTKTLSSHQQLKPVLLGEPFVLIWPLFLFLLYCNTSAFISVCKAALDCSGSQRNRDALMRKIWGYRISFTLVLLQAPGPLVTQEHFECSVLGLSSSAGCPESTESSALCIRACCLASGPAQAWVRHTPLLLGDTYLMKQGKEGLEHWQQKQGFLSQSYSSDNKVASVSDQRILPGTGK